MQTTSLTAYKLKFLTPLHINSGQHNYYTRSQEVYGSDALKSALFSVLVQQDLNWQDRYHDFFDGFKVSSCYPYYRSVYFLPRPYHKMPFSWQKEEASSVKKIKKIAYVDLNLIQRICNASQVPISIAPEQLANGGRFLFDKAEDNQLKGNLIGREEQQRVRIGYGEDSEPYAIERVHFDTDAGLYFLASFTNPRIRETVECALRMLADAGIGSDRHVGNGLFTIEGTAEIKWTSVQEPNCYIALGFYTPTRDELKALSATNTSYQLEKRGGYIAGSNQEQYRHFRKQSVYMLAPGSVIGDSQMPDGKLLNLKPDTIQPGVHNVWRDGRPIFIPALFHNSFSK